MVWIKRATARHGMLPYRILGLLTKLMRLPVLHPVPNPGGSEAIRIEIRRLQQLAASGLRVPEVLASCDQGFIMRHLAADRRSLPSLGDEMAAAVPHGADAVLALWAQGLDTLDAVHARGQYLSQAFARNMVRCPDGVIACIDFEDDPADAVPAARCAVLRAFQRALSGTGWRVAGSP